MYQLIKKNPEYHIVQVNDIPAFRHTGFGAKLASAKLVLNIRDLKPANIKYGLQWQLAVKQSDIQVVLSQEMREAIAQRFAISPENQQKIRQIYSIVDLEKMQPVTVAEKLCLRDRLNIPQETFAIGYVATFNEKKAQLKFITQSGRALKEALPGAVCYFLGDCEPEKNPYAAQCLEATKELHLENHLQFRGYSPYISDWYKALDLVIIPTRNEGLARCMIESLSCGIPVVSFDVCSAKEILEGYNCGLVVKQGNYQELVEKIVLMAQNQGVYETKSKNGATTAQQLFACEVTIQQYENLYQSLCES